MFICFYETYTYWKINHFRIDCQTFSKKKVNILKNLRKRLEKAFCVNFLDKKETFMKEI